MFVAVDETLRYDHSNESYDKLSPFFKNIKSFNSFKCCTTMIFQN